MFNVGDRVLYGIHGVCTIIGLESMRFGKSRGKYFCLQPLEQPDSRYYVPAENETAVAKLSPLMTKESIIELLHSENVRENNWIPDENQRKLRYRELLSGLDRAGLLNMIYCLHQYKEAQLQAGKKLHQCDDSFLRDAKKLMNSELCLVLDLEPAQVSAFIREHLLIQA